jgi:hypothetical protein
MIRVLAMNNVVNYFIPHAKQKPTNEANKNLILCTVYEIFWVHSICSNSLLQTHYSNAYTKLVFNVIVTFHSSKAKE